MEREIKFRGIVEQSGNPKYPKGTWVYGGISIVKNTNLIYIVKGNWSMYANPSIKNVSFCSISVLPETVGQFIGHRDKNEIDMYGGDIIEDGNSKYVIEWFGEGWFKKSLWDKGTHRHIFFDMGLANNPYKIIGSIHQDLKD